MSWLARRAAARRRGVGKYDTAEARVYGETQGLGWLTADEEQAYLADLSRVVRFAPGTNVLDVGAGTGVTSMVLAAVALVHGSSARPHNPSMGSSGAIHPPETLAGSRTSRAWRKAWESKVKSHGPKAMIVLPWSCTPNL